MCGDLVSRVEANDRVATLLARDFGNAAASCLTAAFLGAVMISYDAMLAAIVLGSAALNLLVLAPAPALAVGRGAAPADRAGQAVFDFGRRVAVDRDPEGDRRARTTSSRSGRATMPGPSTPSRSWRIYQQTIDLLPTILLSLTSAAVLGIGALRSH